MRSQKDMALGAVGAFVLLVLLGTVSYVSEIASEVSSISASSRRMQVEIDTKDRFVRSDTAAAALGPLLQFTAGRNATSHTGFLRSNTSFNHDTTSTAENGFYCFDDFRLLYATTTSTTPTANCTLTVYSDADVVAKLAWSGNKNFWTPTKDSSNGWIAPESVIFDSTDVISLEVTAKSVAPVNPSYPMVRLFLARQED